MKPLIIDVREPYEFNSGHVSGAINIPPADILAGAKQLHNVPKDTELILYCRTGSRSSAAMHYLKQLGYTNLKNGINKSQVEAHYGK